MLETNGGKQMQNKKFWSENALAEHSRQVNHVDSLTLWYKPPVAPWKDELEAKLRTFQTFGDNWDDEGAIGIGLSAFLAAWNLFGSLIERVNLPKPNIVVGYKGDIVFLWARNKFEIKIVCNQSGTYSLFVKDCSSSHISPYPDVSFNDLIALLDPAIFHIIA